MTLQELDNLFKRVKDELTRKVGELQQSGTNDKDTKTKQILFKAMLFYIKQLENYIIKEGLTLPRNDKLYQKLLTRFLATFSPEENKSDLHNLLHLCNQWNDKLKNEDERLHKSTEKYRKIYLTAGIISIIAIFALIVTVCSLPIIPVIIALCASALSLVVIMVLDQRNNQDVSYSLRLNFKNTDISNTLTTNEIFIDELNKLEPISSFTYDDHRSFNAEIKLQTQTSAQENQSVRFSDIQQFFFSNRSKLLGIGEDNEALNAAANHII